MKSSQIHVVEVGKKKELQLQIDVPTKKGTERRTIPESQASPEIKAYLRNPSSAKGKVINVEFEMQDGQAKRVRLAGQSWTEPPPAQTTNPNPNHAPQPGAAMFENPYNFIPAPPRNTTHETLGDAKPIGHHRYHADKWSGRISVELTTVTPLLIPDDGTVDENGHKTFGIRKEDQAPYLPPTSIKGVLRAAYEAVTNSRMGVFMHCSKLEYKDDQARKKSPYSFTPQDLLDQSLLVANELDKLSPADRVFGWVNKKGHGQFKGQLHIGAVTCLQGTTAIEPLGNGQGIPLAILGAPKPAQARFYAAKNSKGEPLDKGSAKSSAYGKNQGLRGRKVYPHQKQATHNDYWDANTSNAKAITVPIGGQAVYREWQRLAETQDKIRTEQNRSINEWVKPETTFNFDVDVTNLSGVELGALLWLLNQPDKHYFRFGGGKPLGFGSATLKITSLDLRDGEAIRADYAAFGESDDALLKKIKNSVAAQPLIDAYKQALPVAVGDANQPFDNLRVIKAFVNAAKGGDLPVHYPRSSAPPNAKGENFTWFRANEKNGQKNSLPDLVNAVRGLPIL